MKIEFTQTLSTTSKSYIKGQVYDLPKREAEMRVRQGLAKHLDSCPEGECVAGAEAARPQVERAVAEASDEEATEAKLPEATKKKVVKKTARKSTKK